MSAVAIFHHLTVGPLDHELRTAGDDGQDSGKSCQECVESVRGIRLGLYVPYGDVGLVPSEESSGERRRLGHISKQGNALLRFLLVEAAQVTVRSNQEWRSKFFHLAPGWYAQTTHESEMALFYECRE